MGKIQYDESWLVTDSRNLGFLFQQCDIAVREHYGIELDIEKFLTAFMHSNVRKKMEAGNPRLLSQSYIDTIICFIEVDCDEDVTQFELENTLPTYFPFERLWIGRMYPKIAYRYGLESETVIRLLPFDEMRAHFRIGHEISEASYLDSLRSILRFE